MKIEIMRTKSIILASILLFGGGSLLSWVLTEQKEGQAEIVRCQLKYGTEKDDYLKQYNEWLQLPAEQRAGLPLFLDEDGKTKTREQIALEQRERLKADIDKIATGKMTVHQFSDVLYGENWTRTRSERRRMRISSPPQSCAPRSEAWSMRGGCWYGSPR